MEPKRELSSIDLRALVTELRRYEGAVVDKAYLYDDDLVRLKLRDFDRGRVELLIQVGELKRAHVADPDRVPDAPGRPPNFAKMLRNRIAGANLVGVEQHEFDRVLTFRFAREDRNSRLVAELFGQGNVAALDESGEVVGALSTIRLKSRTVAPGAAYGYPESRIDPLDVSYEAFVRYMDESDTDVVRTLATQLNLGGLYAEEVCARAGVDAGTPIDAADDDAYRPVYDALARIDERLRAGEFQPRVYVDPANDDGPDRVVDVTPFPLVEREGLSAEGFDSFNAAVDDYFHRLERRRAAAGDAEAGGSARPEFEAEIAKRERIIDQQEGAIESFQEEAALERERAELLYANYDLVDEILSTVRAARGEGHDWEGIAETLAAGAERGIPAAEAVVDVDGDGGRITVAVDGTEIPLDPSTGVEKNADRLYTEAKRIEEKAAGAREAVEETRAELASWRERREEWEAGGDGGGGEDEDGADGTENGDGTGAVDWLSRSSIPLRTADHWYERFRWFHTSDDFLVIGGRNADQNEELVAKYTDRHDRFLHAEAHGGPVTLLKASGPSEPSRAVDVPDSSLREAARFAVSYSSVWKDGRGAGDAYAVAPKTPESGEYLEKGGFVVRGDRTYYRDVACRVAVGVQVDDETRAIGGPPSAVEPRAATSVRLEPGRYAQNDAAKMVYRELRGRFADESFVRKVASPDRLQEFLPPGGSETVD
jgi:predicted ribosome quality control (RQC) complex YloA/Tae2 family protein